MLPVAVHVRVAGLYSSAADNPPQAAPPAASTSPFPGKSPAGSPGNVSAAVGHKTRATSWADLLGPQQLARWLIFDQRLGWEGDENRKHISTWERFGTLPGAIHPSRSDNKTPIIGSPNETPYISEMPHQGRTRFAESMLSVTAALPMPASLVRSLASRIAKIALSPVDDT
jgi:hypothetical protein